MISRREFLGTSLAIPALAADAKPNIVILLADDLGWNDVGYHGSEIRTPNIDKIAARGVKLERYYAYPVCSPTRTAIMTGRSPIRMGIDRPLENVGGVPMEERLMPQWLKPAGYQTAMAGKWHLGLEHVKYFPNNRGFDSSYGHLSAMVDYNTHISRGAKDWHRDGQLLDETGYSTDLIAAEAVRVIKQRRKDKPLFLYTAFNAPHSPLQAPQSYLDRYANIGSENRRIYAAMVTAMDDGIGRIVAAIESEGMTKNTIVIFMSDNGGPPQAGGNNGVLRSGKGSAFEGGLRVPACMYWPGVLQGGREFSKQMIAEDWLPTLAAAVGVSLKGSLPLDGVNMLPALKGGKVERGTVVMGAMNSYAAYYNGWKLVKSSRPGETEVQTLLFRIDEDPNEQNDLAAKNPEMVAEMTKRLESMPKAASIAPGPFPGGLGKKKGDGKGAKKGGGGISLTGWTEITRPPYIETAKRDQ